MTEGSLLSELMVPFSYNYMLKAMWVSALVGGVCAFLSAYLMLKGWSLMGDALAHSIVPGVAAAYILGAPFAVGAFFAGLLAAAAMQFVKLKSRLREDAVIGIVYIRTISAPRPAARDPRSSIPVLPPGCATAPL